MLTDHTVPNDKRGKNLSICLFRKLQPPENFERFYIRSHSLPFVIARVLRILSTNWPQISGVNPSLKEYKRDLQSPLGSSLPTQLDYDCCSPCRLSC